MQRNSETKVEHLWFLYKFMVGVLPLIISTAGWSNVAANIFFVKLINHRNYSVNLKYQNKPYISRRYSLI